MKKQCVTENFSSVLRFPESKKYFPALPLLPPELLQVLKELKAQRNIITVLVDATRLDRGTTPSQEKVIRSDGTLIILAEGSDSKRALVDQECSTGEEAVKLGNIEAFTHLKSTCESLLEAYNLSLH